MKHYTSAYTCDNTWLRELQWSHLCLLHDSEVCSIKQKHHKSIINPMFQVNVSLLYPPENMKNRILEVFSDYRNETWYEIG